MSGWTPEPGSSGKSRFADRCLVTGGSGFIGAQVVRRLIEEGHRVRCLVRATSDVSALERLGAELTRGDLTSRETVAAAAIGCRQVVHCGALVSDWATVAEIHAANVVGTRNVLDASVAASVERFVHLSTTDVYGYPGSSMVDESFVATGFSNWYSEAKRAAEDEIHRAHTAHELEAVILRPATVYGPGSVDVVGEMARAIRAGRMLMIGSGNKIAGLAYVENVVDAVLLALRHERAAGEAFNVSDGLEVTWREFLGDLANGLGSPKPKLSLPYPVAYGLAYALEHGYRVLRRGTGLKTSPLLSRQAVHVLGRDQEFSNRKLREQLGWEPRVSYAEGLQATLSWLRAVL